MTIPFSSPEERAQYIQIFCEEADENLEALGRGLLALTQNPDQLELAWEPYRAAHTLKGSAGYLGLDSIGSLARGLELVLEAVHQGKIAFPATQLALLAEAVELIYRFRKQLDRDETVFYPRAAQVVAELERLLSARFIRSERYGTRATTVIRVSHDGFVNFHEQNFSPEGVQGVAREFHFKLSD